MEYVLVSSKTKKIEKFKRLEDVYNKIDWSLVESKSIR